MTLTEKVKVSVGRLTYKVFDLTSPVASTTSISPSDLNMEFIKAAMFTPKVETLSAGSTTPTVMKVMESSVGGTAIYMSGVNTTSNAYVLEVWGY